jgi:hypothetical protein
MRAHCRAPQAAFAIPPPTTYCSYTPDSATSDYGHCSTGGAATEDSSYIAHHFTLLPPFQLAAVMPHFRSAAYGHASVIADEQATHRRDCRRLNDGNIRDDD